MNAKPIIAALIGAALALLLLSGCKDRVRIVSVPCIQTSDVPAEPESVKPYLTGDAVNDATVLARGLLAWKEYGIKLHALTVGCTSP